MRLTAGSAVLEVDPRDGGRWTSLSVDGLELLSGTAVDDVPAGVQRGCFAMAPYAGRLGHGVLRFRGAEHRLPVDAPPHAIHGHVFDVPWEAHGQTLTARLAGPWPFAGTVTQELDLRADGLTARLSLHAVDAQPVTLGYHPWFARRLARGGDLQVELAFAQQYVLGETGLPTGELALPTGGPYDDCFLGGAPPRLVWPGALTLDLTSSADHWVVFDRGPEVVCVEPQTGPPDAVALGRATVVEAGGSTSLELVLAWS